MKGNPLTKTTPSRFVLARMRRGLQCWQVADALRISRRKMNDIEKGRTDAKPSEVEAIAEYLRFPVRFFSRPHIDIPSIDTMSLRPTPSDDPRPTQTPEGER